MRWSWCLLVGTLLFQSAISPLVLMEDCPIQEVQHRDDDCPPLCVTCVCSPASHGFQCEIVRDTIVALTPAALQPFLAAAAPDAPIREILHVPLASATL